MKRYRIVIVEFDDTEGKPSELELFSRIVNEESQAQSVIEVLARRIRKRAKKERH